MRYKGSWVVCDRDCPTSEVPGHQHEWMPAPALWVLSVDTDSWAWKVLSALSRTLSLSFTAVFPASGTGLGRGSSGEGLGGARARLHRCVCPACSAHTSSSLPPRRHLRFGSAQRGKRELRDTLGSTHCLQLRVQSGDISHRDPHLFLPPPLFPPAPALQGPPGQPHSGGTEVGLQGWHSPAAKGAARYPRP